MFEVFMDKKINKDKRRKKRNNYDFEIEQDENFVSDELPTVPKVIHFVRELIHIELIP